MHVKSLTQGDVASIGERGNDQTFGTAEKLVLVRKVDVCDGNDAGVQIFVEVGSGLLGPLKVIS